MLFVQSYPIRWVYSINHGLISECTLSCVKCFVSIAMDLFVHIAMLLHETNFHIFHVFLYVCLLLLFSCARAEGSCAILWSCVVRRPSVFTFSTCHMKLLLKRNSTKLDWKQDLNVNYQVCVFRVGRKNKMATPASDWLRHFRLLLWNC